MSVLQGDRGAAAVQVVTTGPAVAVRGLTKRFGAAPNVLEDVSLEVAEGEFLCILGASGCGKSTLLGLVADLDHELSGGMRQRVAMARALAQDSHVLLMDEPFAALDAITRDVLHEELVRIRESQKLTVLFVTHNVREAVRLGDRVVLLSSRPGRVVKEYVVGIGQPRRIESPEVAALSVAITEDLRTEIRRHGGHS
jgi:ABC-type nitrate/sulfonate/bicarbonate transport system ATPase subunit